MGPICFHAWTRRPHQYSSREANSRQRKAQDHERDTLALKRQRIANQVHALAKSVQGPSYFSTVFGSNDPQPLREP
jgi:hypothetical protein